MENSILNGSPTKCLKGTKPQTKGTENPIALAKASQQGL